MHLLALSALLAPAVAFLPPQNPPWPASYAMNRSTLSMACNSSGYFDPVLSSSFGIVSFDWSNNKKAWAAAKPMTDEQELLAQARLTRAQQQSPGGNAGGRIFSYFNLVKGLPWFDLVREKLGDPQYSGWFLRFDPAATPHVPPCDDITGACSVFYHDQLQTPAVPGGNRHPDGECTGYCDCGPGVPCGEYLWDHRNESCRQFLVDTLVGPSFLGADGGGLISGVFIDDFWCSTLLNGTGACQDPAQGPTEIDPHSQADMGLSDQDVRDITVGWLDTMTRAQSALLQAGGYTWSLIPGQDNANAQPRMVSAGGGCTALLRAACASDSPWQGAPLLLGLTPGNASAPLPYLEQELAAFLLARGPHAYVGWGVWGMSWPAGMTWNTSGGAALPLPQALASGDWGTPSGLCAERAGSPGVFERQYTAGSVQLDCNTFTAVLPPSL